MFNEDLMIDSSPVDPKQNDIIDKKGDGRPSSREKKGGSDEGEGKKRDTSIKRKDIDRLNRIHSKRGRAGGNSDVSPGKKQEANPARYPTVTNSPTDECPEVPKVKSSKKSSDEVVASSRFKKKIKDAEKAQELKEGKKESSKKSSSKPKAVTAFGTTFHKTEEDLPPMPKRRPSSSTYRFGRAKRNRSKEGIVEESGDDARRDSSLSQLRPSTRHSNAKLTLSKNKLTEMVEESNKDKAKGKGGFELTAGKRARSPYHTPSKIDTKKQSSKVRVEGDPKNNGGKQDEKGEIGKDLSFFEKLQQNVRAYFTPKVDIAKLEEEEKKKIQEGDKRPNDESIMIRKDERIKCGVKEDFMKGDKDFFKYNESERKCVSEKGYRTILTPGYPGGMTAKGNGSGPGGNPIYPIGAIVNTYYPNIEYDCKKLNCINRRHESTETPRTGSFHRTKTFQKNALAPPPPKSSTSISLILEPDEQVQNFTSAYGMASAFAQIQEFHEEIIPREEWKIVSDTRGTTCELMQEDSLTPIVNCLPGESVREWTKGILSYLPDGCSSCPKRFRYRLRRNTRKATDAIRSCKSTSILHLESHSLITKLRSKSEDNITINCKRFHNDIPLQEEFVSRTMKSDLKHKRSEKPLFIPTKRNWLVFSVTETVRVSENKSIQTPRRNRSGTVPPRGNASSTVKRPETEITDQTAKANEGYSAESSSIKTLKATSKPVDGKSEPLTQKSVDNSPSITLKDIINLSRRIFEENCNDKNTHRSCSLTRKMNGEHDEVKSEPPLNEGCKFEGNITLGRYLEKLMEEKKNYLNLQKTKNYRKAQKVNFIADSFNFFNLLNQEFLSTKTSDPRIEELRNAIAGERDPNLEEYLDMYKNVIRKSFTKPEQNLMDKAKLDLERYTDMYYDLMKHICLEKEGEEKKIRDLPETDKSEKRKINYYEVFKQEKSNMRNPGVTYDVSFDRVKPKLEKSQYVTNLEQNRRNGDSSIGKNKYFARRSTVLHSNLKNQLNTSWDTKTKGVVELLSPPKSDKLDRKFSIKEGADVKEEEFHYQGKVLLTISVCDDGLTIKQVKGATEADPAKVKFPEEKQANMKGDRHEPLRRSVSEINRSTSITTSSDNVEKTQSEQVLKVESDVTIYPKSSIDEDNDSSESPVENSMLKFRTFRKLLNEGLKYFTSFNESAEMDGRDRSKMRKYPECFVEQIPKPTAIIAKERSNQNDSKAGSEDRKKSPKRDLKLKIREAYTPLTSKNCEGQGEKVKKNVRNNLSRTRFGTLPKSASPNKKDSFKEGTKTNREPSLWWRNERNIPCSNVTSKPRKLHAVNTKKPDGSPFRHKRMSDTSKTTTEIDSSTHSPSRYKKKLDKTKANIEVNETEDTAGTTETPESNSHYATPPGSYFEWKLGIKNLKELIYDTPQKMLNPGGLAEGKLICRNEEKEEKELQKMDYSYGDDKNGDDMQKISSANSGNPKSVLRLGFNNPLKTEWDQLVEASSQRDYQRVTEVLNQFMGNISEAWKAAACLKDLIQPKTSKQNKAEEEDIEPSELIVSQDENEITKKKAIDTFRNFLRIVAIIFEEDPQEDVVRKELSLLVKELFESSAATIPSLRKAILKNDGKTRFANEIAEMPEEVKAMVVKELITNDKIFNRDEVIYEPAGFVEAIKNVGQNLKRMYFTEKSRSDPADEGSANDYTKPKKIYYRLPKRQGRVGKNAEGSAIIKSNLQSLAEKIKRMHKEEKVEVGVESPRDENFILRNKKSLSTQSSVYFDAADTSQGRQSETRVELSEPNKVELTSIDESYFSMNAKSFAKYRDVIYDKIINLLQSENPSNFNYGMALLGRMMERDSKSTTNEREKIPDKTGKYNHLLDKLMETCLVIESEMKEQFAICDQKQGNDVLDEKEIELIRTCEYLKGYVDKMKALIKEMKSPDGREFSIDRIEALEKSRERNMERQFIPSIDMEEDNFLSKESSFIDNAVEFINSIGSTGLEKFSNNFLPDWLARNQTKENTEFGSPQSRDTSELLLESNKAIVKSLRRKIERRQKKIKDMIDQAVRDGVKRESSLSDEKIMRNVRDLKKCYALLEKMICDPTLLPPKWLKVEDESPVPLRETNPDFRNGTSVMALLEDIMEKAVMEKDKSSSVKDQKMIKYSQSMISVNAKPENRRSHDQVSIGSLTWVKINYAKVNFEGIQQPEMGELKNDVLKMENGVPLRPKTA